ncbi:MAG: hypothetical protein EOO05_14825 [Chitinophagaceae bacterium]|nr:MAG: hypothetical protein EOO05_14825 [Chitinophagaceae bacterium]
MKRTIGKLVLFFAIMACPVIFLSSLTRKLRARSASQYFRIPEPDAADTGWYFIGSSRVQMSVDTSLLASGLHKQGIHNLGVSGATFLTNCFVAAELMKSHLPKILFIELSAMLTEMPVDIFEQRPSIEADMYRTARRFYKNRNLRDQLLLSGEFANHFFSARIFYYDQLRNAVLHNAPGRHPDYGFIAWPENGYSSDKSILRWPELSSYMNPQAVEEYRFYFQELQKMAAGTNTRIIFFMPVTFGSEMERRLVIPVYNSLPLQDRIELTPELVQNITDKKYLMNANHFNEGGARVYSNWLVTALGKMKAGGYLSVSDDDTTASGPDER